MGERREMAMQQAFDAGCEWAVDPATPRKFVQNLRAASERASGGYSGYVSEVACRAGGIARGLYEDIHGTPAESDAAVAAFWEDVLIDARRIEKVLFSWNWVMGACNVPEVQH
jgi:hypothetical protein